MIYSPRALVWALLIAHAGALRLNNFAHPRRYLNSSTPATTSLTSIPPEPPGASIIPKVKSGSETPSILDPAPKPTYLPDPVDGNGESQRPPIQTIDPDPAHVPGDGEAGSGKPTESGDGSPIKTPRPSFSSYTRPTPFRNTTSPTGSHAMTTSVPFSCSSLRIDEPATVWVVLPNPKTVIVTVGGNYSTSLAPLIPEFTPPIYCPAQPALTVRPPSGTETTAPAASITSTDKPFLGSGQPATSIFISTSTFITTSKNPVTIYTTPTLPYYPIGGKTTQKETVKPSAVPRPLSPPDGRPAPGSEQPPYFPPSFGSPSFTAGPIIDGGSGATEVSQVTGPLTNAGGRIGVTSVPTIIQGVTVGLAPSFAVIEGSTYTFATTPRTITVEGVPVSVGPSGLGFPQITVAPLPQATNVVILDGEVFSAVGSSIVVFDGTTLTYGESSTFTTEFHGEAITLGYVISYDGTTLGGASNTGTQLGIAGGISVTQIGESVGVISSTSLIVGPQAIPTTVVIATYSITANSDGLELAGTTLLYPFNPSTQAVTAGGITFSQIGSTMVVIGGSTYTIGADSNPTSKVFNGQTISFGPGGIGFSTTTFISTTSPTSTSAGAAETSKNSGVGALKPMYDLLGICVIICIRFMM